MDAIFLGERHNSENDHLLQSEIIEKLHNTRIGAKKASEPNAGNLQIGLEMVQKKFQPVLDKYIAKATSDDKAADLERE